MALVPFSNLLDDFASGRADDFDGKVTDYWFYPYVGKSSETGIYYLFLNLHFEPNQDSGFEPFDEAYFVGSLFKAVPSKDGKTPAGATEEEYQQLAKQHGGKLEDGKEESYRGKWLLGAPGKGSGYEFLSQTLAKLGFDFNPWVGKRPDFLLMDGHFNRLPQDNQTKSAKSDKDGDRKVLVPTLLNKGKSSSKPSDTAAASVSTSTGGDDEFTAKMKKAIIEALTKAPDNSMSVALLMKPIQKAFSPGVERTQATTWLSERDSNNIRTNLAALDGVLYYPDTDLVELDTE